MDILPFLPHQYLLLHPLLRTPNFSWGAKSSSTLRPCGSVRSDPLLWLQGGTGDPDPANQSSTPSWPHPNWFEDGHVAQTKPMELSPTT